jgi:hypothetical protein
MLLLIKLFLERHKRNDGNFYDFVWVHAWNDYWKFVVFNKNKGTREMKLTDIFYYFGQLCGAIALFYFVVLLYLLVVNY